MNILFSQDSFPFPDAWRFTGHSVLNTYIMLISTYLCLYPSLASAAELTRLGHQNLTVWHPSIASPDSFMCCCLNAASTSQGRDFRHAPVHTDFLKLLKFKQSYDTSRKPTGITGREMFSDTVNSFLMHNRLWSISSTPPPKLHSQGPQAVIQRLPWFHTPLPNEFRIIFLASSWL